MNATIAANLIKINSVSQHMGLTWLTIDVPNGWDDCKKLTNKVLKYNGQTFTWRSWNSDRNVCYFIQSDDVAEFVKKVAKKA